MRTQIPFSDSRIVSLGLLEFTKKIPDFVKPLYWVKGAAGRSIKISFLVVEKDGKKEIWDLPKYVIDFRDTKSDEYLLVFDDEFEILKKITDERIDRFTYDLRKEDDYPNFRGARFRTTQVFECPLCGALTNEIIMGGSPGYGVRALCPQIHESWHKEVSQYFGYVWAKDHFEFYRPPNHQEVISKFRMDHKDKIKNDLFGKYNLDLKDLVTNY